MDQAPATETLDTTPPPNETPSDANRQGDGLPVQRKRDDRARQRGSPRRGRLY